MGRSTAKKVSNSINRSFTRISKNYNNLILEKVVSIFTPFPERENFRDLKLTDEAIEFIQRYEPKVIKEGLYRHQYELLKAYANGEKNFIMTSATGSGKSLCFWTWVVDSLIRKSSATALLCFPTQALMWGQAERIAKISENVIYYGNDVKIPYSGVLNIKGKKIPWTVWKGKGTGAIRDKDMEVHEKTYQFKEARIRIATLDKVHWSLIRKHVEFTKNLECLVLDEAHMYDGVFGANVFFLLRRIYIAKECAKKERPFVFLASATLTDARSFASKLLSIKENEIYHQKDTVSPQIDIISIDKAKDLLKKPPSNGLLRIVLLIDTMRGGMQLYTLMFDNVLKKEKVNILYFSDNKLWSRLIRNEIIQNVDEDKQIFIYDGDLTAPQRRKVEMIFNNGNLKSAALIATSALELGVDIENLDICLIENIPRRRADFIQRIGRVGRRVNRPGLIVLKLTGEPFDRFIAQNPDIAFRFDISRSVPIPSYIEMQKLRHMAAVQIEECYKNYANNNKDLYQDIFKKYFGKFLYKHQIQEKLRDLYPGIIEITFDIAWAYKGFRAIINEKKIPLRNIEDDQDVAWIDDMNIVRDAHPEAIYLDAEGMRWRVIEYKIKRLEKIWDDPENKQLLVQYLKSIEVVYVQRIYEPKITRGIWEESYEPIQIFSDLPKEMEIPNNGLFEFGIWEYSRSFAGYYEIIIDTKEEHFVHISKISERFRYSIKEGRKFPFLQPLTFRTYGWRWFFLESLGDYFSKYDTNSLREIETILASLFESFFTDILQASDKNLYIHLSITFGYIIVLDATPGGNGLSETLLKDRRLPEALLNCINSLKYFTDTQHIDKFKTYILQLCRIETQFDVETIIEIIKKIKKSWRGE